MMRCNIFILGSVLSIFYLHSSLAEPPRHDPFCDSVRFAILDSASGGHSQQPHNPRLGRLRLPNLTLDSLLHHQGELTPRQQENGWVTFDDIEIGGAYLHPTKGIIHVTGINRMTGEVTYRPHIYLRSSGGLMISMREHRLARLDTRAFRELSTFRLHHFFNLETLPLVVALNGLHQRVLPRITNMNDFTQRERENLESYQRVYGPIMEQILSEERFRSLSTHIDPRNIHLGIHWLAMRLAHFPPGSITTELAFLRRFIRAVYEQTGENLIQRGVFCSYRGLALQNIDLNTPYVNRLDRALSYEDLPWPILRSEGIRQDDLGITIRALQQDQTTSVSYNVSNHGLDALYSAVPYLWRNGLEAVYGQLGEPMPTGSPRSLTLGEYVPATDHDHLTDAFTRSVRRFKEKNISSELQLQRAQEMIQGLSAETSQELRDFARQVSAVLPQGQVPLLVPIPTTGQTAASPGRTHQLAVALAPTFQGTVHSLGPIGADPQSAPQVSLTLLERIRNVVTSVPRSLHITSANLRRDHIDPLNGRVVILVDDVRTTGATVERLRQLMIESGATHVFVVTLAQTRGLQEN